MSETPNAERILITKMVVASGGDYDNVEDEIQSVTNDPAHKLVLEAMDEYASQVLSEYKEKLKSVSPPPQAESIPDGENDWIIGAPSFSRTEVDNLLYTQRAMIFNDFQSGLKSEEDVRALLKNPRKPKY